MDAFQDASIQDLDTLLVEGRVSFAKTKLIGNIEVKSKQTRLVSLAQNGIEQIANQKLGF